MLAFQEAFRPARMVSVRCLRCGWPVHGRYHGCRWRRCTSAHTWCWTGSATCILLGRLASRLEILRPGWGSSSSCCGAGARCRSSVPALVVSNLSIRGMPVPLWAPGGIADRRRGLWRALIVLLLPPCASILRCLRSVTCFSCWQPPWPAAPSSLPLMSRSWSPRTCCPCRCRPLLFSRPGWGHDRHCRGKPWTGV